MYVYGTRTTATLPPIVRTVLAFTLPHCLLSPIPSIVLTPSTLLSLTPSTVLCPGLFLTMCTLSGGCGLDGIPMPTGVCLSRDGSRWHDLPPMQNARGGFGLVVCGDVLIAVGGSTNHTAVHKSQVQQVSHDLWLWPSCAPSDLRQRSSNQLDPPSVGRDSVLSPCGNECCLSHNECRQWLVNAFIPLCLLELTRLVTLLLTTSVPHSAPRCLTLLWQSGPRFAQHLDSTELLELAAGVPQLIANKGSSDWSAQWRDGPAMTKARRLAFSVYRLVDADQCWAGIQRS